MSHIYAIIALLEMIRSWFLVNALFHLLFYDTGICTWFVEDMNVDDPIVKVYGILFFFNPF